MGKTDFRLMKELKHQFQERHVFAVYGLVQFQKLVDHGKRHYTQCWEWPQETLTVLQLKTTNMNKNHIHRSELYLPDRKYKTMQLDAVYQIYNTHEQYKGVHLWWNELSHLPMTEYNT